MHVFPLLDLLLHHIQWLSMRTDGNDCLLTSPAIRRIGQTWTMVFDKSKTFFGQPFGFHGWGHRRRRRPDHHITLIFDYNLTRMPVQKLDFWNVGNAFVNGKRFARLWTLEALLNPRFERFYFGLQLRSFEAWYFGGKLIKVGLRWNQGCWRTSDAVRRSDGWYCVIETRRSPKESTSDFENHIDSAYGASRSSLRRFYSPGSGAATSQPWAKDRRWPKAWWEAARGVDLGGR